MRWTLHGKDPAEACFPLTSGGRHASGDGGFSLIEVLVAIAVIGTVMTAMAPFLVQSLRVSDQQRSEQAAIQVANDALERVRALDPSSLLTGRGARETERQRTDALSLALEMGKDGNVAWTTLANYLGGIQQASDPLLPSDSRSGQKAPLPTAPYVLTVNGTNYEQQWYIDLCWLTKASSAPTNIGGCQSTDTNPLTGPNVPYFRVVVAVTWQHRSCPAGKCIYIASTLVSKGIDPIWMIVPELTSHGDQTTQIGTFVTLSLPAAGGQPPLVWSASGLPDGLTIDPSTGVISGRPESEQSLTTRVTVTDAGNPTRTDSVSFGWRVFAPVQLANPGAQDLTNGDSVSLNMSNYMSGGLPPYAWRAESLPDGLSIDSATGMVTGTIARGTRYIATVGVTAGAGGEASRSVVFNVAQSSPTDLRVTMPNPSGPDLSTALDATVLWTAAAEGANPANYKWSETNLPPGLTVTPSTGVVSGRPTTRGPYRVTLTVKSGNKTANLMFDWSVT